MKDTRVRNHELSIPTLRVLLLAAFMLCNSLAFAQPYIHERSFGTAGTGPGQFGQITAVDQDSEGNYVILDGYVGEFQVCSDNGICTEYETAAKIANEHGNQWGLAVNSQDQVFITDQMGKVERCNPGEVCEVILTEYDGLPLYPWGIAIDSQDRIYIADVNYARILVCDANANCSSFGTWGSELGEFSNPYGLAITPDDRVLVVDSGNLRVQICDHVGNCEDAGYDNTYNYYGAYGQGMALLPSGTMISTGYGYAHVNACTPGGACRLISRYDYYNSGYLQSPAAVLVNENKRLVIGDYGALHFLRPNITINPGINDAWVEAGILSQGLLVSVFEKIPLVFIAWFTYEATRPSGLPSPEIGEWGHRWITLQGGYQGNVATLGIYLTEGGAFEDKTTIPDDAKKIGEATLTVHDCHNATLVYNIEGTSFQGTKKLTRVAYDNVPTCEILSGD